MNTIPCGRCAYYDPLVGPRGKDTKRGWCAKKSKYRAKEGPGQLFPPGVDRVAAGELAKPVIVKKLVVIGPCPFAKATATDALADKKAAMAKRPQQ